MENGISSSEMEKKLCNIPSVTDLLKSLKNKGDEICSVLI